MSVILLYFGSYPEPIFLLNLIIALFLFKGLSSFLPIPPIIPLIVLALADLFCVMFFFLGDVPGPNILKNLLILILLIKGGLAIIPKIGRFLG